MHAGGEFGGADNRGEKRNVLIVSVLLPIIIDLALRNKTQRRIEVLQMREQPVLLQVATAPEAVMLDTEVEDHAPAAILVSQVFSDCHVAAPLAVRGSMPVCQAVRRRGPSTETIQSCDLDAPMYVLVWSP